jgi:predicted RND superfamily exporter protein
MLKRFKFFIIAIFIVITVVCGTLIPKVKINYDTTKYLPKDSVALQSLNKMEEEFSLNGSFLVMISLDHHISEAEANAFLVSLTKENVESISYQIKENDILFTFNLTYDDYSNESQSIVKSTLEYLEDYEAYYYGQTYFVYEYNLLIAEEMPKIILLVIPIAIFILFLTTASFIDPLIFILVVLISVIINMGTNYFLKDVSYMTNAIGGILQFAVCMDYSIIFLNKYEKHKESGEINPLKKAWKSSLVPIISASLTTVAGFVAIMFMKYRIGLDIGLVLSKGVIITLITVITLLPCIIVIFDKLRDKTRHRNMLKAPEFLTSFIFKSRKVLSIIAIIIMGVCTYLQTKNIFVYGDNSVAGNNEEIMKSKAEIEEAFGLVNNIVILVPKDEEMIDVLSELDKMKSVKQIIAYDYSYSETELMELTTMYSESMEFSMLFQFVNKERISFREINDLFTLLTTPLDVSTMKVTFAQFFGSNIDINIIYFMNDRELMTFQEVMYAYNELLNKNFDVVKPDEINALANIMMVDVDVINGLSSLMKTNTLSIYDIIALFSQEYNAVEAVTLFDFIDESNVTIIYQEDQELSIFEICKRTMDYFEEYLDADTQLLLTEIIGMEDQMTNFKMQIESLTSLNSYLATIDISFINKMFLSDHYQRMILVTNLKEEAEESIQEVEAITAQLASHTTEYYLISSTATLQNIKQTSENDYLYVTIISIILIVIIIGLAFKSFIIPFILVFLIEGAIFINMAIPAIFGNELLYIGYLIVGGIQLGATIDYGILLCHHYVDLRKELNVEQSMKQAVREAFPSILTSGLILSGCGLMLYFVSNVGVISALGRLIGLGGMISMTVVLTILPQFLVLLDKFVIRKQKKIDNHESN